MLRPPPKSTLNDTRFPYTTPFRSPKRCRQATVAAGDRPFSAARALSGAGPDAIRGRCRSGRGRGAQGRFWFALYDQASKHHANEHFFRGASAALDPTPAMTSEATPQPLDDASFKRELAAMLPHLRAFGRSLTGNADLADDMVQETMLTAWKERKSGGRGKRE